MANGLRRVRSVNDQPRLVQQERACTQRTTRTAGQCYQHISGRFGREAVHEAYSAQARLLRARGQRPIPAMNSRRFSRLPRQRARAASAVLRLMIISAFVACCCLMMRYLRLAVPSLRSIRLRTELTIARRTNAISEWAFRRRNVGRHAPCAATLPPMRGRRCARASQPTMPAVSACR